MRKTILLPGLNGNGTANPSIELPIGFEYFKIILERVSGSSAITTFTSLQVNINGENTCPVNFQDLDEINKFDGLSAFATNGILEIDFENQKFIDGTPRMATSVNTGVPDPVSKKIISSFNLTWTQSGADTFIVKAVVGDPDPVGPGAIKRFQKWVDNWVNGEFITTQAMYGTAKFALLRRLFLKAPAGTISRFRIVTGKDQKPIFDRTVTENNQLQSDGGKTPGSYYNYVADMTENGMPDHLNTLSSDFVDPTTGLAIARSLQLAVTDSTAEAGTYISEFVGTPS